MLPISRALLAKAVQNGSLRALYYEFLLKSLKNADSISPFQPAFLIRHFKVSALVEFLSLWTGSYTWICVLKNTYLGFLLRAKKDAAAKPSNSSGGKKAKKKWSAKKVKDKSNNLVILDKPTYDRLFKEVPTYKLISQSVLVDRLKLNGSLARIAIRELEAQGLIKPVSRHHAQVIYTRATGDEKKAE